MIVLHEVMRLLFRPLCEFVSERFTVKDRSPKACKCFPELIIVQLRHPSGEGHANCSRRDLCILTLGSLSFYDWVYFASLLSRSSWFSKNQKKRELMRERMKERQLCRTYREIKPWFGRSWTLESRCWAALCNLIGNASKRMWNNPSDIRLRLISTLESLQNLHLVLSKLVKQCTIGYLSPDPLQTNLDKPRIANKTSWSEANYSNVSM